MTANKPPRGTAKVIRVQHHQTGHTNTQIDREHRALQPGMRISRNGKPYHEGRKNRSDVHGKRQHKFR
jgi:hypothetical protein